ncbi:phosphoribosylanthranilate isomerase [Rhodobacteraceae bacterium RKSG542]|uniref:phosphoribosylanthranilate isomerase n=1 Tax=Pseudovibrio flavus TaxID=2529854 RepID=UPI003528DD14|nr:phosphoribosylanthranilate isomerase [Pseudovibrio flavus]
MSDTLIKICGLSDIETLDTAIDAGAGMIGLVFFPKSPRHISIEKAKALAEHARGRTQIVALTVNMGNKELGEIVEHVRPDVIQLHGSESIERCAAVKSRFGLPVMKAFGISTAEDLEKASLYGDAVDRFLFDAKPPKDSNRPGGNGVSFDWTLLKSIKLSKPYMLSGGLGIENVREALTVSGAPAVDVSSGVEREKGIKDVELIKAFVKEALSA